MKDMSRHTGKITVHYAAAFFVYFAAFCMVRSFISVYLLDRGFSYTRVGIITGLHMFFTAVIQPYFARILSRFPKLGLRRFLTLCCFPSILCSLLTFVLPARMVFFIPLYIVFGLFEIGLRSLMVSLAMEYINAGIPMDPGIGRGFGSVGYAAANVLLGMLIVRFGSPVSHALNIGLMLLFAVLVFTLPDPNGSRTDDPAAPDGNTEAADSLIDFVKNDLPFALFAASGIFTFFGQSIVNTYMPNVAAQFGLGSDFTGALNALAAFLELIPMMFYTRISKKTEPLTLLRISAVFFLVKILTATLARNAVWLTVSQSMQILAYAVYALSSVYFTNQAVSPRNRVLAQGLLIGANEAGFMVGGLIGGVVLDHLSIRELLWMGVFAAMIGSGMMLLSIRIFQKR